MASTRPDELPAGYRAAQAVFEDLSQIEIHSAPALPLGHSFSGLVYLHGSVDKPEERLVLTDADFGRAYLTEGWARRFLQALFSAKTVLFIGYSHSEALKEYLPMIVNATAGIHNLPGNAVAECIMSVEDGIPPFMKKVDKEILKRLGCSRCIRNCKLNGTHARHNPGVAESGGLMEATCPEIRRSSRRLVVARRSQSHPSRRLPICRILWTLLGSLFCFSLGVAEANMRALQERARSAHTLAEVSELSPSNLEFGSHVSADIAGGRQNSYQLVLKFGQFASLGVSSKEIGLVLTVVEPDGRQVTKISCPYAANTIEPVYISARNTGTYRVIIRPRGEFSRQGRYELRVIELRRAERKDKAQAEAQRLLSDGLDLLDPRGPYRTPSSRARAALVLFERSLHLSSEANDVRGEALSLAAAGLAYNHLADWPKAADRCDRALRILRTLHDTWHEASMLAAIGGIIDGRGDFQHAVIDFDN